MTPATCFFLLHNILHCRRLDFTMEFEFLPRSFLCYHYHILLLLSCARLKQKQYKFYCLLTNSILNYDFPNRGTLK